MVLRFDGFDVVTAADVNKALRQIGSQVFEVLLTDLQMPPPGDGLTVASAMRHSNPNAATFASYGPPNSQLEDAYTPNLLGLITDTNSSQRIMQVSMHYRF